MDSSDVVVQVSICTLLTCLMMIKFETNLSTNIAIMVYDLELLDVAAFQFHFSKMKTYVMELSRFG